MNTPSLAIGAFGAVGLALFAGFKLLSFLTTGEIALHSRFGNNYVIALSDEPLSFSLFALGTLAVVVVAASLATLCFKIMLSSD